MIEFLWGILVFTVRAIVFALDIAVSVSRMRRFARWVTGSDAIVEVPPDPKILPPAAQRALAEAEQRRRDDAALSQQCAARPASR